MPSRRRRLASLKIPRNKYFRNGKGFLLRCAVEDSALILLLAMIAKLVQIALVAILGGTHGLASLAFESSHDATVVFLLVALLGLVVKDVLLRVAHDLLSKARALRHVWRPATYASRTPSPQGPGPEAPPPSPPRLDLVVYRSVALVALGWIAALLTFVLISLGVPSGSSEGLALALTLTLMIVALATERSILVKLRPHRLESPDSPPKLDDFDETFDEIRIGEIREIMDLDRGMAPTWIDRCESQISFSSEIRGIEQRAEPEPRRKTA